LTAVNSLLSSINCLFVNANCLFVNANLLLVSAISLLTCASSRFDSNNALLEAFCSDVFNSSCSLALARAMFNSFSSSVFEVISSIFEVSSSDFNLRAFSDKLKSNSFCDTLYIYFYTYYNIDAKTEILYNKFNSE
jgi:hypothetical protein